MIIDGCPSSPDRRGRPISGWSAAIWRNRRAMAVTWRITNSGTGRAIC